VGLPGEGRLGRCRPRYLGLVLDRLRLPEPAGRDRRPDPAEARFLELGFWFFMLAAFTIAAFFAAFAESLGLVAVLGPLAVGAAFLGVGFYTGVHGWILAGSWVLIASAIAAFYSGTALMLENAYGRTILPLGKYTAAANVPGRVVTRRLEYAAGEPGVRQGQ
jgi:uncharacterized protein